MKHKASEVEFLKSSFVLPVY